MRARTGRRADGQTGGAGRHIVAGLKRILGMPDYAAYVDHLRRCHPERPVPSEKEFFDQYVAGRYGNGASRCC